MATVPETAGPTDEEHEPWRTNRWSADRSIAREVSGAGDRTDRSRREEADVSQTVDEYEVLPPPPKAGGTEALRTALQHKAAQGFAWVGTVSCADGGEFVVMSRSVPAPEIA